VEKINLGRGKITALANTDSEWNVLCGAAEASFIRSINDWDEFVSSGRVKDSVLSTLSNADLMMFRSHLQFHEATRNGVAYRRGCAGWYVGDLMKDHKFTDEQLQQVAALFGIGPTRMKAVQHKFGDICDGEVCCRPRQNFFCPDGKPDCTC
jgi:hypothetical protein